MSKSQPPIVEVPTYNPVNYQNTTYNTQIGANKANYPVVQGQITFPNGAKWTDGTAQTSAFTGAALFGSSAGTTYTSADVTLDDNGRITNITNGSGGGGGVSNPMTSDLDANGFSIFNADTFAGMDVTATGVADLGEVITEKINGSAAHQYYNQGAVAAGNRYFVAAMDPKATGEGSILVVSRCLDPGLKQTTVFAVNGFASRANVNVLVNLTESDTPIWDSVVVGDNGSTQMYIYLNCVTPCSTWEIRTYMQQDDKGTGSYGSYWKVVSPATAAGPPTTTYVEQSLSSFVGGQSAMSGNLDVKNAITCNNLTASTSVSTNTTNTNEIAENGGIGTVGFLNSINMNNNDIQSANTVGALAFVGAALNITIPIGHPVNGPLYVDTNANSVGVGIQAPQDILDIAKSATISGFTESRLQFYGGSQSAVMSQIVSVDTGLSGGDLNFLCRENGGALVNKMTIFQDGRVGLSLNRIENMADPLNAQDAATKAYVDASVPSLTGYVQNPMTVDLDGGAFQVNNISDPTSAQDAATKNYVDTAIASLPPSAGFQFASLKWFNTGNLGINAAASQWVDINNMTVASINDGYGLDPLTGRVKPPQKGVYKVRLSVACGSAPNGEFNVKCQILHVQAAFTTVGVCCESMYFKKFSNTLAQGGSAICEGMVRIDPGDEIYCQVYWTSEPAGLNMNVGNNYKGTFNFSNQTNDGTEFLMNRIGD